jgi:peroxiredoxin
VAELGPGDAAPVASLPGVAGGTVALPGDDPLTVVVLFKASCPTCRWALPWFQRLHEAAAGRPLAVRGVAQDDPAEARAFAAELGLTFPIGIEEAPWAFSAAWGALTVPTFFLVGADGVVRLASAGFARDDLREAGQRAAALDGGPPLDPFPAGEAGEAVPAFRPG